MLTVREHDFAIYDLALQHRCGSKGNDLLHEITNSPAYLVDNNVPWKQLALARSGTSFVLGRTISDESENLQGVLFNQDAAAGFPNVFTFGLESVEAGLCIVVHRLDKNFASCFRRTLPRLTEMSESEIAEFNSPAKRDDLRRRIVKYMFWGVPALDSQIELLLPACRGSHMSSCRAAELVYARFLLSLGKHESQKELKKLHSNHRNLFGDTRLIQEALMLGIGIATCDKRDVVRMAAIAKIQARAPEQIAPTSARS